MKSVFKEVEENIIISILTDLKPEFDTEFAGYDIWEAEDLPQHGFLAENS
jgi:hypothetical protein